jgi:hypothetical protein
MSATVFPVGHYGGLRESEQVVRVGWSQHRIDEDAFGVWVLAHGLPEVGKGPWTVDDVLEQSARAGLENAAAHVTRLADAGLLSMVSNPIDATQFARTHRMDVLFVGLGNSP